MSLKKFSPESWRSPSSNVPDEFHSDLGWGVPAVKPDPPEGWRAHYVAGVTVRSHRLLQAEDICFWDNRRTGLASVLAERISSGLGETRSVDRPGLQELRQWCKREIDSAIAALREEFRRELNARDEISAPSTPDPIAAWVNSNSATLSAYRGKHIAIHPTRGIVASGDDLLVVQREVRAQHLSDEVEFDFVPPV
jgi:hypothetical protein